MQEIYYYESKESGSTLFSLSVQAASGTSVPIPINATVAVISDGTNMKLGLLSKGYGTVNSASVTAYTAVAGDQLLTNTTTAGISITLPTSAATGDELTIVDARGTFNSNNLTIARNGHNINGSGSNLVLSTNGQTITLVYVDQLVAGLLRQIRHRRMNMPLTRVNFAPE